MPFHYESENEIKQQILLCNHFHADGNPDRSPHTLKWVSIRRWCRDKNFGDKRPMKHLSPGRETRISGVNS